MAWGLVGASGFAGLAEAREGLGGGGESAGDGAKGSSVAEEDGLDWETHGEVSGGMTLVGGRWYAP